MKERKDEVQGTLVELAERMIERYARGLLTVGWLVERLGQAWCYSGRYRSWNATGI